MDFLKRYSFLILLVIFVASGFARNNYKGVTDIVPQILQAARQEKIDDPKPIVFDNHGFHYELTPLYDFELNGLVVSKQNYKLWSTDEVDKVAPYDVCMVWGGNVSSGFYKQVSFSQDSRWCYAQWSGNVSINWEEFGNNHLVINDPAFEHAAASIVVGDQLKIKGKLVNIKATPAGQNASAASTFTWNSGTSKSGQGAGACKVIFVEDLQVLKPANVAACWLFRISGWGLLALIVWIFARPFLRRDFPA